MDREFQSPIDLMNVPAVSRTGLLGSFSPGTILEDSGRREVTAGINPAAMVDGSHLLGFRAGYANYRGADDSSLFDPATHSTDDSDITGDRAGFERIFDVCDIGPVFADSQRWFDPTMVGMLRSDVMASAGTPQGSRDVMYNRIVETLQPPYNSIGRHRTPGKINLNTTPDFIRRGAVYPEHPTEGAAPFSTTLTARQRRNGFLDIGEQPRTPGLPGQGLVSYNPNNSTNNGDGFSSQFRTGVLFGNGSVHRALTWGISTFYDLDDSRGAPSVLGQLDQYGRTVDTRFGKGFKAFIESRRGYGSATAQSTRHEAPDIVPGVRRVGINPSLDWRYPTRFAGVFAPAGAASDSSVQRFMRLEGDGNRGVRRRTHDMSVLRPHPDFDLRTMNASERTAVLAETNTDYSINVEANPTGGAVTLPPLATSPPEVVNLRMPLLNKSLFERSQAELQQEFSQPRSRFIL